MDALPKHVLEYIAILAGPSIRLLNKDLRDIWHGITNTPKLLAQALVIHCGNNKQQAYHILCKHVWNDNVYDQTLIQLGMQRMLNKNKDKRKYAYILATCKRGVVHEITKLMRSLDHACNRHIIETLMRYSTTQVLMSVLRDQNAARYRPNAMLQAMIAKKQDIINELYANFSRTSLWAPIPVNLPIN